MEGSWDQPRQRRRQEMKTAEAPKHALVAGAGSNGVAARCEATRQTAASIDSADLLTGELIFMPHVCATCRRSGRRI
ncbi:MAG: hypothetical protein JWQ73_3940 [Variovorax sp.]|nr:hypothetical protein [Variovorax sp.]